MEVRPEQNISKKVMEVEKMGFKNIFISSVNKLDLNSSKINIIQISTINDLKKNLFES